MTDQQRAELAGCQSFSELHERLSSSTFDAPTEAAQASVGKRLTLSTAEELQEAEMLVLDASGRVCLKATPPIRRTKVVPEPWRTNILVRGWRRLTGRTNPPAPPKDERVLPAARWRTVGSIRRYILLVLMLGQTIVAGWYMKGIMPYQGWSFVDLNEVLHQPLPADRHASAAVCIANQHPDSVRDSVLLGVGRFLDRADGLPRVAHRPRQIPHFR